LAITLVGEVVNQCDAVTGFNAGAADSDIFIETPSSIGLKTSNTLSRFYTTTLGATAPYNFSSGGSEFGWHIIMWFNSLTPADFTSGFRIIVGDTTNGSRAEWDVPPSSGYTGGFVSKVINTARNFSRVEVAGTTPWTTTGNPSQLTNITQMGGAIQTTTTIMGNFNNTLIDQITIGLGIRADGGTAGTPNTFEIIRTQDEGSSVWGWVTSNSGNVLIKGKIYIGPETGDTTSVFNDSSVVIVFVSAPVATGFYEFSARGGGTDINWNSMVIRSENSSVARWNMSIDSTLNNFIDTDSLYNGFDILTLNNNTSLTKIKFDDGNKIIQSGSLIDTCTILNANTLSGSALIVSDNPANIKNCNFNFNLSGHAIEIVSTGSYIFQGNLFSGYGANDTDNAAIFNNSSGSLTLNITGDVDSPTFKNGTNASTTINNNTAITLTGLKDNTEVRVYTTATTTELAGIEDATDGTADDRSFTFSLAAGTNVDIRIHNVIYEPQSIINFSIPSTDTSIPIQQRFDRTYNNP